MTHAAHQTRFLRATLAQEARIFLGPVPSWRRVQLILPASPKFFIGVDVLPSILAPGGRLRPEVLERIKRRETDNPDQAARVEREKQRGVTHPEPSWRSPDRRTLDQALEAVGWDRNYKMPELTSGVPIRFYLGPGQWMTGMVGEGIGTMTVITEHREGPHR